MLWLSVVLLACAPPKPTPVDTATPTTPTGATPTGTTPAGTPTGTTPTGTTPTGTGPTTSLTDACVAYAAANNECLAEDDGISFDSGWTPPDPRELCDDAHDDLTLDAETEAELIAYYLCLAAAIDAADCAAGYANALDGALETCGEPPDLGTGTGGGDTGTTTPRDYTPIYDIQDPEGAIVEGTEVWATGVVTAVARDGVFIQDPAGGAQSGIWVFMDDGWEGIYGSIAAAGRIEVYGRYEEYDGALTEINLWATPSAQANVLSASVVPAPEVVPLATLVADPEPWEGVRIRIVDVQIADDDLGYGEFLVSDPTGAHTIAIDDHIHAYDGPRTVGTELEFVQGPLHWTFGTYKILPTGPGDLQPR